MSDLGMEMFWRVGWLLGGAAGELGPANLVLVP